MVRLFTTKKSDYRYKDSSGLAFGWKYETRLKTRHKKICVRGYHAQAENKDDFLSLDLGVREFSVADTAERFRRYRRFVYETGAVEKNGVAVIDKKILKKEKKKDYVITRAMRFKHRTRYFSYSGIIGSKKYLSMVYQKFKENFKSSNDRKPNPVKGLGGIYALKKLSE